MEKEKEKNNRKESKKIREVSRVVSLNSKELSVISDVE